MAVKLPLELDNKTGPGWDQVSQQAKKALSDIEKSADAASNALDKAVKQKTAESRVEVEKLGTSFLQTGRAGTVGLSSVASQLAMIGVPLGGTALATAAVSQAFDELVKIGDRDALKLQKAFTGVEKAWHDAFLTIGNTDLVKGGIRYLTESANTLTDLMRNGVPIVKEFWAAFRGDASGMLAAIDEQRKLKATLESITRGERRNAARENILAIANKEKLAEFRDALKGEFSVKDLESRVGPMRRAYEDESARTGTGSESSKKLLHELESLEARIVELKREGVRLDKESAKGEKERTEAAERLANRDPFRSSGDAKGDLEEQRRIMADRKTDTKDRLQAEERIKELTKEVVELERRELADAQRAAQFREHQLDAQRKINIEIAREIEMKQQAARTERARIEMQEANKFKQQLNQQLGGQPGMGAALNNLDPRKVREAIAAGRDRTVVQNLKTWQQRDLDRFDANHDPMNLRDALARDRLVKQQQRDMVRERQKTRAGAFRDFNRGNVDGREMLEGQSNVMGEMIDDAASKNQITKKTAAAMRELFNAAQANAQESRDLRAELDRLTGMIAAQNVGRRAAAAARNAFQQ